MRAESGPDAGRRTCRGSRAETGPRVAAPRRGALAAALLGAAALPGRGTAAPVAVEQVTVAVPGGSVEAERHVLPGRARRSAVLLLHGGSGLVERLMPGYRLHAQELAREGFAAWLFSYYTGLDKWAALRRLTRADTDLGGWAGTVGAVAGVALEREGSTSARIGLVGFSQGGAVAVGAAGLHRHISAIAVLHGFFPEVLAARITRLPPTLIIHGEADSAVPLSAAQVLERRARQLGAPTELVVYPNQGHMFDLDETHLASIAARQRVRHFLSLRL